MDSRCVVTVAVAWVHKIVSHALLMPTIVVQEDQCWDYSVTSVAVQGLLVMAGGARCTEKSPPGNQKILVGKVPTRSIGEYCPSMDAAEHVAMVRPQRSPRLETPNMHDIRLQTRYCVCSTLIIA